MRIAMLGTRGVPANYGGFETCAEQLGYRLAERGHEVTVYCRTPQISYPENTYRGMRLVKLPTIQNKYLDTIAHTFLSSLHALPKRYDVALYFNAGNSPVSWMPRLAGTKTILNVDGLDWRRQKWNKYAKRYIKVGEFLATKFPNVYLTDSLAVQLSYQQRFNSTPRYIPYGSDVEHVPNGEVLARYDLTPQKYILFVGRLVPENRVEHLIQAFTQLDTAWKCVVVGDAPYEAEYIEALRTFASGDNRIVFTGYLYGQGYHELGSNAGIFVETSEASGTHPAILEAMAFGNCCIVNNIVENLETLGDAGFSYNGQEGAKALKSLLEGLIHDSATIALYRQKAKERAHNYYSWESVTNSYEKLFYEVMNLPLPERLTI